MASLAEITQHLDSYLHSHEFEDQSWNGLQISGREDVRRIGSAVDASSAVFAAAIEEKIDLLLVHHGLYWRGQSPLLSPSLKKRITPLLTSDTALYASHLPLDAHAEVGNNQLLLAALGATPHQPYGTVGNQTISWIGELAGTVSWSELCSRMQQFSPDVLTYNFGTDTPKRIAVLSGSGGISGYYEAVAAGADTYITGDPAYVLPTAKDENINLLFAGHYETETFGVRALGDRVAQKFGTESVWLDIRP